MWNYGWVNTPFPFSLDADLTGTDSLPLFSIPGRAANVYTHSMGRHRPRSASCSGICGATRSGQEWVTPNGGRSSPQQAWHLQSHSDSGTQGNQKDFKYGVCGNVRSRDGCTSGTSCGSPFSPQSPTNYGHFAMGGEVRDDGGPPLYLISSEST